MKKRRKLEAGPVQYALSEQDSIGAKRGVKHEDAGSITRAKRMIQHKHTLSLQHALSARSERAKRAYESPKPISAAINREPVQEESHTSPQNTSLSIPSLSSPFLSILFILPIHSFFHPSVVKPLNGHEWLIT